MCAFTFVLVLVLALVFILWAWTCACACLRARVRRLHLLCAHMHAGVYVAKKHRTPEEVVDIFPLHMSDELNSGDPLGNGESLELAEIIAIPTQTKHNLVVGSWPA